MVKFYLLVIIVVCFSLNINAQTTYTWNGGAVGDYQAASNWTPARATPAANDILAFNAISPIEIANVPFQTIGSINILSGTSPVIFKSNVTTNILTIAGATPLVFTTAGSILSGDFMTITLANTVNFTISSGTLGIAPSTGGKININGPLTLSGGTLDFDVAGTGGTTIGATGIINYNSGTFNSLTNAAIIWNNGSRYNHSASGSSASNIPCSIWAAGSTCTINGMNSGTIAPGGLTNNFFNIFTWNCPSQAGNVNLNLGTLLFNVSNLNIINTNNQFLSFGGATGANIYTTNYTQTGGNVALQSGNGNSTLMVGGAFSHTSGLLDAVAGSGSGTGI
jgi:hypothetical protein